MIQPMKSSTSSQSSSRGGIWSPLLITLGLLVPLMIMYPARSGTTGVPFSADRIDQVMNLPDDQFQKVLSGLNPNQKSLFLKQVPVSKLKSRLYELTDTKRAILYQGFPELKNIIATTDKKPEKKHPIPAAAPPPPRAASGSAIAKSFSPELGLKQFGYDLFATSTSTFKPEINLSVPLDHMVGPGDSFKIFLDGATFRERTLEVDGEGMLFFPEIGLIPVSGMRFQEFKNVLINKIKERLVGTELAHIAMNNLRPIQVFVLGRVNKPGAYTVNALSTISHVLQVSGGVQHIGSLRNIQLKRKGHVVNTLDVYDMLLEGDDSADVRVQGGDVVFVPPIGPTIGIGGEVRRPGVYELLHEKSLKETLNLADGFLPNANPKLIKLERIDRQENRILFDLDYTKSKHWQTTVQSGDTIRVPSVLDRMEKVVTLKGYVDREEVFQWYSGMRLTDALPSIDKLKPSTDLSYTLLTRIDPRSGRLSTRIVRIRQAMANPSSSDNPRLKPKDSIIVFSLDRAQLDQRKNNLAEVVNRLHEQARFSDEELLVTISGHVRFPGIYPFSTGMDLKNLIYAAGDLQPGADLDYALVVRSRKNGEIDPYAVRPGMILQRSGKYRGFQLKARDHVLIFKSSDLPRDLMGKFNMDSLRGLFLKPSLSLVGSRLQRSANDMASEATVVSSAEESRIIQTFPPETRSRMELLEPVLLKLRKQATSAKPARIARISGAVRFPGEYPLVTGMRVSDLIQAGGKLAEPAYTLSAELTRFQVVHNKRRNIRHIQVNLEKILHGDPSSDIKIQPNDTLRINIIPYWADNRRVTVSGRVRFPGVFFVQDGENLVSLVKRAGGLTQLAYPKGAIFLRKSLKEREIKERESLLERLEVQIFQEDAASEKNENSINKSRMLRDLVKKIRSTEPQGRLAIDLPKILENAKHGNNIHQIILRDGDRLIIPQTSNEVTVFGAVNYPASHQFDATKELEDYIAMSGGFNQMSNRSGLYVIKANGQVYSNETKDFVFGTAWFTGRQKMNIDPRDTIVVPINTEKIAPMTLWKDISQILSNLAITAATLNTIGAL